MSTEQTEHFRRFLSALDELSRGTPLRRLKNANDVARDIALPQDRLDQILAEASAAGLLERHPDNMDLVRLTDTGVAVARSKARR